VLERISIFFTLVREKNKIQVNYNQNVWNHPALDASRVDFGSMFFLKNSDSL
jgi:hypothetical protein